MPIHRPRVQELVTWFWESSDG